MPDQSTDVNLGFKPPETKDNEWKDLQFRFDGKWIPNVDPSLIGANNYSELENLRYRDSGLEGVNGYARRSTNPLDGTAPLVALGNYPILRNGHQLRSQNTQRTYALVQSLDSAGGQGRVFVNRTAIGSTGDFDATTDFWKDTDNLVGGGAGTQYPFFQDLEGGLEGRFSNAPQGNVTYANGKESMIFGGDEQPLAAAFLVESAGGSNPVDVTDILNNNLDDSDNVATLTVAGGGDSKPWLMMFTTRPVQSFELTISSANTVDPTDATWSYWDGTAWQSYLGTDGTDTGTIAFAQSGTVTLTKHTDNLVKLKHFEELYLYGYLVQMVDASNLGSVDISKITVNTAFQSIKDVWDGIYRQPIQFQWNDDSVTATYDYTLQVSEPSSMSAIVGGDIGALSFTNDYAIVMFTQQMAAIRFTMLGSLINTVAAGALTFEYWDGNSWIVLTSGAHDWVDGTLKFRQTGIVSWTPQDDEQPQTLYSSFGYAYRIKATVSVISGAVGNDDVVIDLISGVPVQDKIKPFDFTAQYKSRVMLCSYSAGNESNRMDFSAVSAPDVYNGSDTSDHGSYSLKFGGIEKVTAATQLYNRFGSNILTMLLVLKETEVFILIGDTPDDFKQYPVSNSLGCPAPLTLATAEVNFDKDESNLTRNVAIWLSNSGPLMFDGAVLSPIRGIENYFDPNTDEYIEWTNIANARGWIDTAYKEYNLLIPSGSAQSLNNIWFVFDLVRRKWYLKDTSFASTPQCAFQVVGTSGERAVYGGIDTGYMIQFENSSTWDEDTAIIQLVKTGDFFPSKNLWDETTIRKFKLLVHKFSNTSDTNVLNVFYYNNTDGLSGAGVSFAGSDTSGHNITFTDRDNELTWNSAPTISLDVNQDIGSRRILKLNEDHNYLGWAHAFKFQISTTNAVGGFKPIAWGVQYRIEKKDNKAT